MSLIRREYYHGVVVELRGRYIGSVEGSRFLEAVDEFVGSGKTRVVADLSRTDFMDSTGIGTLMVAQKKLREAGGDLRLAGLEERIRALFLMTHLLGSVFEDYPSASEALVSYWQQPEAAAA